MVRHVIRMPKVRFPHDILNWKPQGTRPGGRPKNQWEDDVGDLREMGIFNWKSIAQDKEEMARTG